MICAIKHLGNKDQLRLLKDKTTDLNRYYSKHNQKLKFITCNLPFVLFVEKKSKNEDSSETLAGIMMMVQCRKIMKFCRRAV